MKRMLVLGIAVAILSSVGCAGENLRQSHQTQAGMPGASAINMQMPAQVAQGYPDNQLPQMGAGPPNAAAYAYPYYTTRAPRDFLMKNPPHIGR